MTLTEAYSILEVEYYVSNAELKENYWWLVRFYHPDNSEHGNAVEFRKIVEAYKIIVEDRKN